MTIEQWLQLTTHQLNQAGISTARLDALVLLEDTTNKNRAQLLAHPELELTNAQISRLRRQITRRARHEPLSYIRGVSEFYGRQFLVNKHVLEPRPESENMIDLLKSLIKKQRFSMADVGTGSGALGITAKLELPSLTVDLLDISDSAIKVAQKNVQRFKAQVSIYKRNLLLRAPRSYDVILANLPYVPNDYKINRAASLEPRIAILGGPDGLDLYRQLFKQLAALKSVQFVLTESLPFQHQAMQRIARSANYELRTADDFIQAFETKV